MARSILTLLIMVASVSLFSQTTLLECGQNSGQNFDGWYVSPHTVFDAIEFDDHGTYFFSEFGGNFDLSMTRKMEELANIETFGLLFNFDVLHHAMITSVVYYTSIDGLRWTPIQSSKNNTVVNIVNSDFNIKYIRAVARVSFENNGKVACNYVKVTELGPEKNMELYLDEKPLEDIPAFYIFSHAHTLNVETSVEEPYEVMITAMSGQIVYRDTFIGSNRIDLPFDLSGVYIVNIIHQSDFAASKKIALQ